MINLDVHFGQFLSLEVKFKKKGKVTSLLLNAVYSDFKDRTENQITELSKLSQTQKI